MMFISPPSLSLHCFKPQLILTPPHHIIAPEMFLQEHGLSVPDVIVHQNVPKEQQWPQNLPEQV